MNLVKVIGVEKMSSELNTEIENDEDTNDIEIMEFTISNNIFGIKVSSVKEIMMDNKVKPIPHAHPCVEGVFKPRDVLLTVINLAHYLDLSNDSENQRSLFIITSFEDVHVAFRVDAVVGIKHVSKENIDKPDKTIYGGQDGIALGIAKCDDHLITVLNFEKIISNLSIESLIQTSNISGMGSRSKNNIPIVVVQNSVSLSKMILQYLELAGFTNVKQFDDGENAWQYLNNLDMDKDILESVACVITDIEMPKMDGHKLTKAIKSNDNFKQIPIIIFSSLISKEMEVKGREAGADAQISKPDISKLISILDDLLGVNNNDEE